MGIDAKGFRLQNRIGEAVGQILLVDRNGVEFCAGEGGHLPRDGALIVIDIIESQGEGANLLWMMARCKSKNRTRVEAAAEIDTNRDIGPQTNAYCLFQHV